MKSQKIMRIVGLVFPFIFLIFFASVTFGQTGAGSSGVNKSPHSEEFDKTATEKLKKMSSKQVEELDRKLAEALTLLYDREYARALPIFKEISGMVETMDVMFWFATCAAKTGDLELAEKKYRQMLEVDPNLHRVRLEIATMYFSVGRYKDARQELDAVLKADPPETVKNNIRRLLASIEKKTRRFFPSFRFSQGFQRDGNISSGPEQDFIPVADIGSIGPLTETQRSLRDWVAVTNMRGGARYDMGEKGSWMWNSTGSFYQTHNSEYYQFDFTQWRLTTGLWLVGKRSILKLPWGYAENIYEHDHLYDTWDFSPSYEYFFTKKFSVKGLFSHSRDTYEHTAGANDKSGEDNIKRTFGINPNLYLNNRKDIVSFYFSDENVDAKNRTFTYDTLNVAVSYFKRFNVFNWDMELYTRYKWTKKEYATPALLWPPAYLRKDRKDNFYFVLSRNFGKRYFASILYNWINNHSNTGLYRYNKYVYGFNMGFKF